MWIEPLFNHLGVPLSFGLTLVGLALPLGLIGISLRRRARRERARWEVIGAARTELRAIVPGRVAVVGSWRNLGAGRGLVSEGEECAVVERGADAVPVVDGTSVVVAGFALRQIDNPEGGSYRGRARVWLIEGDLGEPVIVGAPPDLPARALRSARVRGAVGVALLAASVAVAVGAAAVCYRAADEDGLYRYTDGASE